ncbi:MAG: DUF1294 domain-containing protein [Rhodobacteraceae bacterium]|nr:DUF1294 domain-containing protein [Paracoccaceae bacterium]
MTVLAPLAVCALSVNVLTYAVFALDKRQARRAGWRVPERALLMLSLIGGTAGAKLAQHMLRHKTRKEPFRTQLNAIVLIQMAALCTLIYPPARIATFGVVSGLLDRTAPPPQPIRIMSEGYGPGSG